MIEFLYSVFTALLGAAGFALLFRIRLRHLPAAAIGGALAWSVYLLFSRLGGDLFVSNLAAAFFGTLYAQLLARLLKAPVPVFLLPTMIPMVPGGSLFYATSSLVEKQYGAFFSFAGDTVLVCLGIAGGILVASVFFPGKRCLEDRAEVSVESQKELRYNEVQEEKE